MKLPVVSLSHCFCSQLVPILLAALAISCSGAKSPTTPTATTAPTPVATPAVSLSGSWAGTVIPTISGTVRSTLTVTYAFDHLGTRLTGTLTGGFVSALNLTESQVSGSNRSYAGTLVLTESGRTTTMPGTMAVDTNAQTMSGTFSGINTDGLPESNAFSLRKQ
jgi:hypothetical protein